MQWPCMRISENAKTSRAMRTVRRLSAQQAPIANASHWLYTQSAGSDGLGPSPDAFVASQSLYMHTRTEPQQAAMTMRCANTHCAALKRPAQMCHIICTHNARAHHSNVHNARPHVSDALSERLSAQYRSSACAAYAM